MSVMLPGLPGRRRLPALAVLCAVTVLLGACVSAGPRRMAKDRFHYANSIGDTRETQALLNIVKIRYAEFPTFLDLTQVVTNYTLQNTLVASGLTRLPLPEDKSNEVKGVYTVSLGENPSFVYLPVEGPAFVHKMLRPSGVPAVLALVQTGWEADSLLSALAFSVNGRLNRELQALTVNPADPEFARFVAVVTQAQAANALAIRFGEPSAEEAARRAVEVQQAAAAPGAQAALAALGSPPVSVELCFRERRLSAEARAELDAMRADLGLDPDVACYRVITADRSPDGQTLACQMRSMFQLLTELAVFVDVPSADLTSGAAPALAGSAPGASAGEPSVLAIRSGPAPPVDPLAAVEYSGSWFWIDNDDLESKRTFGSLMLLLSITESGGSGAQLVVQTN